MGGVCVCVERSAYRVLVGEIEEEIALGRLRHS
jgi:hypothetical protein